MKKILLIAASLSFFSASVLAAPDCVTGKVEYTKYNDDDTFTVKVGDKELFTNRWNLQSLLLSAQITGMTVTIKTNACHNGGGFSEVISR
ncbi:Shiga toxin Stx1 subunit B [Escherichia coli]|nr:Shiga toxin Stx1 subunit B [Escherichia coli]ELW5338088.1 Shiga toxin Stx1 subunit B [Escherichia coli]